MDLAGHGRHHTSDYCVSRGDRSRESAKALWSEIPGVYQEHAIFHTDQYEVYNGVIPAERHKAITWRVLASMAIQLHDLLAFFCTKLAISSASTSRRGSMMWP